MERVEVGVLGATGTVGGRIVRLLAEHPWFRVTEVAASPASAGRPLGEALPPEEDGPLPAPLADLPLRDPGGEWTAPLILSSVPSPAAREHEPRLARAGHVVVSNASAHRMEPDVPLVIPELNADHLALLERQRERWPGALVTNPNCSVAGLAVALAPLERAFGVDRVLVTSFQAISGAGRPGPSAGALLDNVVPFIAGEEEKLAREPGKILGQVDSREIRHASFRVSALVHRVPVSHGHLLAVSASLAGEPSPEEVTAALGEFRGSEECRSLPTAPDRLLEVLPGEDRPQPRLDRGRGGGMTVTVGRIRSCPVLGVKLSVLSHNLLRGAAGAAVLNAELCRARGLVGAGAAA